MADQLWVVRAGAEARYEADFLGGSFLAVGFREFYPDDLAQVSEEALRARAGTPAERTYASQLSAFAYRIEVDDYVIVPLLPRQRKYRVGRVTGPYQHVAPPPASGPHRRPVSWLGEFEREGLSEAAINTLGAIQTVFRPTAVEAELRGLIAGLTPESTAPPRPPGPSVNLDIAVDPDGRARIICGFPALEMEQTARHLDPSDKWRGVPGIYVLTGTDVDYAAARAGKERTLTATLIVRPWAYVGLSEDFLGRLASHRQTKPEWRRALLVQSGAQPFSGDDIRYLERRVYELLVATGEVKCDQALPRGNVAALLQCGLVSIRQGMEVLLSRPKAAVAEALLDDLQIRAASQQP